MEYKLPYDEQAKLSRAIVATGAHSLAEGGYDREQWHVVVPVLKRPDLESYMYETHGIPVSSDMFELPTRKAARRLVASLTYEGIHAYISTAFHAHN